MFILYGLIFSLTDAWSLILLLGKTNFAIAVILYSIACYSMNYLEWKMYNKKDIKYIYINKRNRNWISITQLLIREDNKEIQVVLKLVSKVESECCKFSQVLSSHKNL